MHLYLSNLLTPPFLWIGWLCVQAELCCASFPHSLGGAALQTHNSTSLTPHRAALHVGTAVLLTQHPPQEGQPYVSILENPTTSVLFSELGNPAGRYYRAFLLFLHSFQAGSSICPQSTRCAKEHPAVPVGSISSRGAPCRHSMVPSIFCWI